ncbi:hypothetical protein GMORB2_6832 [Geosmithia morbida]|uniref:DUF7137 domain-containing protein n=1 Tax=Geosmithia morbida TaxID=1094350 RepID=A0A9P4YX08_9HYPO|nr:uncharacterized protein GMORB2_6832 [Geosmithia morbida]KAF4123281.1 hypothetical protein GMORB2_6832 [Geosmithia morbida]
MRTTPLLRLAVCLTSLAPLASAWPGWLPNVDTLIVRADDNADTGKHIPPSQEKEGEREMTDMMYIQNIAAETGATATATAAKATKTDDGDLNTAEPTSAKKTDDGDLNTAEPTSTKTANDDDNNDDDKTSKGKKTTKTSSVSIPATAIAGGVSITEPATTQMATPLFKIGDNITLGWNYTGIIEKPTAIDVLISCSTASETWTLTSNMTFETDVSYTWNSEDQADNVETPLLTELYTLIIKNSDADISDSPEAGKLAANAQFTFGLYHPQAYTPYADWECSGCSGAASLFSSQVVHLAVTMSAITIITFTYFVTGWGIH